MSIDNEMSAINAILDYPGALDESCPSIVHTLTAKAIRSLDNGTEVNLSPCRPAMGESALRKFGEPLLAVIPAP